MTVGELKDFLKDIPDNVDVVILKQVKDTAIFKYIKTKNSSGITEELQIY